MPIITGDGGVEGRAWGLCLSYLWCVYVWVGIEMPKNIFG